MATPLETPLILFSGLAADAAVFAFQKKAFPSLTVPEWPVPNPADNLDSYSKRIASKFLEIPNPLVGGASFGGIIALHVAKYLHSSSVLFIGSVRSPQQLPGWIRFARPFRRLLPCVPVRML